MARVKQIAWKSTGGPGESNKQTNKRLDSVQKSQLKEIFSTRGEGGLRGGEKKDISEKVGASPVQVQSLWRAYRQSLKLVQVAPPLNTSGFSRKGKATMLKCQSKDCGREYVNKRSLVRHSKADHAEKLLPTDRTNGEEHDEEEEKEEEEEEVEGEAVDDSLPFCRLCYITFSSHAEQLPHEQKVNDFQPTYLIVHLRCTVLRKNEML